MDRRCRQTKTRWRKADSHLPHQSERAAVNKYLDMLKAKNFESPQDNEPSKPSKPGFECFEGSKVVAFPKNHVPPLDQDGVPCGPCPSCGLGEFWRLSRRQTA